MAKDKVNPELKTDPRMRDPAMHARYRELADLEVMHQAWGCQLWKLERLGLITRQHRDAGDEYTRVVAADRRGLEFDVDMFPEDLRPQLLKTIEEKKRWRKEASELLLMGREGIYIKRSVDAVCLREEYPGSEVEKMWVRLGLGRLETLFFAGRKKRGRNMV